LRARTSCHELLDPFKPRLPVRDLILATNGPMRASFRSSQGLFESSVEYNDASLIFWQVGCGQMPAASEAFEMLRAGVYSERIETETIGCRVEAIGLSGEKSQSGFVAFFGLNAPKFAHDWSLRATGFNQLCNSRGFVRADDVSPSVGQL
jgi:hypothetical protein